MGKVATFTASRALIGATMGIPEVTCLRPLKFSLAPPPQLPLADHRRFIALCRFREHSSTSVLGDDMRRLSECTSAVGMVVRRLMAL
jgi:hypothetical protein